MADSGNIYSKKRDLAYAVTRERSFIKNTSYDLQKWQRAPIHQQFHQRKIKPAKELYKPPGNIYFEMNNQNKLNVHAREFTMNKDPSYKPNQVHSCFYQYPSKLQHSKSSGNMNFQNTRIVDVNGCVLLNAKHPERYYTNAIEHHIVNAHLSSPEVKHLQDASKNDSDQLCKLESIISLPNQLQRSKSMTYTEKLIPINFNLNKTDLGSFSAEIQQMLDLAITDPNKMSIRTLMSVAIHIMSRAIESGRYAVPASKFCITIIVKEKRETFLEVVLNTCRQWYKERDKILINCLNISHVPSPRFTAFMMFITEMFCQLKRRQLQLKTECDGIPPSLVLLSLLVKCCENCVEQFICSVSEIECLFFVLTCIGKDLELQLPEQLEVLLNKIRDAFLNSNTAAPEIRRTLLQLIELQASQWQLPGDTVLYYYPTQRNIKNIVN